MSLIDLIVGRDSLRRQRDATIGAIESQFDPNIVQPQVDFGRQLATEGIGEAGDIARSQFLEQAFVGEDQGVFGGDQARAIAGTQARSGQRTAGLANLESQLATEDSRIRREGEGMVAQGISQQRQLVGQRESQIGQADAMYESELSRRRMGLVSGALGVAGTLATTPFGGPGTSLAERGLTSLFGAGEEAEDAVDEGLNISNIFTQPEGVVGEPDSPFSLPEIDIARDFERRDLSGFDFLPEQEQAPIAESVPEQTQTEIPETLARPEQETQEVAQFQPPELPDFAQPQLNVDPAGRDVEGLMGAVEEGVLSIEDIQNPQIASAVRSRLMLRSAGQGIRNLFSRELDADRAVERLESRGIGF